MPEWVGLSSQPPDFGNALARVAQIKHIQQQGAAAQQQIDAQNRLTTLAQRPEIMAGLARGDPAAIAAVAGTGLPGLQMALPLAQQAAQPNQTRTREVGGQTITEEFDRETRQWRQIGTAPRWQPQQAQRETFGQPVAVMGPDGKPAMVQFGSMGTVRPAQGVQPAAPQQHLQFVPPSQDAGGFVFNPGTGAVTPAQGTEPRGPTPPAGYRWGEPGADGKPSLVPIPGGPAEFITQQVTMPDGTIGLVQIPRSQARLGAAAPQAPAGAPQQPPVTPAPTATETAPAPAAAQPGAASQTPTAESLGLPPGSRVLTTGPGRQAGLTEAQAKANLYGLQMRDANAILDQVQIPSAPFQAAWRNLPEGVVNPILNANDQQYFNALRLFAAGVLRKETGAAFTPNELLDVQSRFFPMPGDSAQVIAQKRHARITALSGIQAELPGQQFREVGQGAGPGGRGTASPPPPGASRGTPAPPPGFEIVR